MTGSGSRLSSSYIEPRAAGHEAFLRGLPVWANPLMGATAREWTAGWKQAQAEVGQPARTADRGEAVHAPFLARPEAGLQDAAEL